MNIVRVDKKVPFPQLGNAESAGMDWIFLIPSETRVIVLGLKNALPPGTWRLLKERSSMSCRGVFELGGVIDAHNGGELMVLLHNVGKKICQLIVMLLQRVDIRETTSPTATVRGIRGCESS